MGENIYMLPCDMKLNIRPGTVGYNNKILVSDEKFVLGKNDKVNSLVLEPIISIKVTSHKALAQQTRAHELSQKPTHEEEEIAFVLFLAGGFTMWFMF